MIGGALLGFIVSLIVIGIMLVMSSRKKPSWDAAVKRSGAFRSIYEPIRLEFPYVEGKR